MVLFQYTKLWNESNKYVEELILQRLVVYVFFLERH